MPAPPLHARNALTPDALLMIDTIAREGSFAAAARELGKVPSALTYNVRQLEEALDVLLFDRSSRQAQLTAAGAELLQEGRRLLHEMDAVANRVKRVASGWEAELAVSVEDILSMPVVFELVQAFCEDRDARPAGGQGGQGAGEPGARATRLRLRTDVLAGTWEALVTGQVDLAIGVSGEQVNPGGIELKPLGEVGFVFCVAPHHPLARVEGPVSDDMLVHHRAVAVADTAQRLAPVTVNLLPGQDVLTVPNLRGKLEAQLRGLGCGFVPEPMARAHLEAGHLVRKAVSRTPAVARLFYAWRAERGALGLGRALAWWLRQLDSDATRLALIERHAGRLP
ncbi:MAG: LysR family transcriptional regulator [Rubrivivax sp.]|nr:LysR family transcriptional regulator [Rubrivivax sp.]